MSKKQDEALNLIKNHSPKNFGIDKVYHKVNKDNVELFFVVRKNKESSSLISYLNSLSSIVERESNVEIENDIFIYDKKKEHDIKKVVRNRALKELKLITNA